MCADNGVVEEGVTQTGQEVTAVVAENFIKSETSVCKMAQIAGVDLFPIDIGMVSDVPGVTKKEYKNCTWYKKYDPGSSHDEDGSNPGNPYGN